jgi:hypothetical protein
VSATASVVFDVSEYDGAGSLLAQVVITVPGPFTAAAVVTGEGAVNALMASCQVTGIGQGGN